MSTTGIQSAADSRVDSSPLPRIQTIRLHEGLMRPKMEDRKTADRAQNFVFTSAEIDQSGMSQASRSNKKHVIIAVSCIVAVTIILAAILVGMHLFIEGQKEIMQFSQNHGDGTKKDATSDPSGNIVQYHHSDPTYEMWVVNDLNKNIQLMKIQTDSSTKCFLVPLSETSDVSDKSYYRVGNSPISDASFLSKAARDTCEGISIYWLYPNSDVADGKRLRRQTDDEITFSYEYRDGSTEVVTSNPKRNYVHYHVTSPTFQHCVRTDFDRDLQVTKIQTDSDTKCYVSRLNRSIATEPTKITPPPDGVPSDPNITTTYRADEKPIEDTSFLGEEAQETCKGIPTYWMYPSSDSLDGDEKSKVKRGYCYRICCRRYRFWFWYIIICWCC